MCSDWSDHYTVGGGLERVKDFLPAPAGGDQPGGLEEIGSCRESLQALGVWAGAAIVEKTRVRERDAGDGPEKIELVRPLIVPAYLWFLGCC